MDLLTRLDAARKRLGYGGLVQLAVRKGVASTRSVARRGEAGRWDIGFDEAHRTSTSGITKLADLQIDGGHEGGVDYQATPASVFIKVLSKLPIDRAEHTFIDLGCGKGRTLILAAEMGFKKIIGVDFSPELCQFAEKNVSIYRDLTGSSTDVSIACQDASTFAIPMEPSVVYLYNPFSELVLSRVLENIRVALHDHPGLFLVYYNPQHRRLCDEADFLQRHAASFWSPDWYIVYRAAPTPAGR